ncbi:Uncharacterised protein [uncultured archaeon]|nr:Uncharacterised protein [uncultured archaeon]
MTPEDFEHVVKLLKAAGITKCPTCGCDTFEVHRDHAYRVIIEDSKYSVKDCGDYVPEEETNNELTDVHCSKCGTRVGTAQELSIFKSAIVASLKRRLEREPTENEFLEFLELLEKNIPKWLDNVAFEQFHTE